MFANCFPLRQVGVDAHLSTLRGHFPQHVLYFLTHSITVGASTRTQTPPFSLDAGIPQDPQAADPPPWQGLWHLRANKGGIFQPSIFFVACGQSLKWVSEESLGS